MEPLCLLYPLPPLHPLVPSSFLATRHPPCILPSFSSVTSLYSLTSSSYASSSYYSTTFFFSCNTAFHPLQLSSLLPNPLPPLQPSSSYSSSASSSPLNPSSCLVIHHHSPPCILPLLHPPSPTHHPLQLSSLPLPPLQPLCLL